MCSVEGQSGARSEVELARLGQETINLSSLILFHKEF